MDPESHICYLVADFLLVVPIGGRRCRRQDWWSRRELPPSSFLLPVGFLFPSISYQVCSSSLSSSHEQGFVPVAARASCLQFFPTPANQPSFCPFRDNSTRQLLPAPQMSGCRPTGPPLQALSLLS